MSLLVSLGMFGAGSFVEAAPLWKQLLPQKRVPADANADYSLQQENGPWLIFACSFTGPEGEQQARDLVLELRRDFNLPAYYYGKTFDLDDDPGRGLDNYGAPIRRRYQRGEEVVQHAVLVGEFTSIDDPSAQELLDRIKTLQPQSLSGKASEETHQALAGFRQQLTEYMTRTNGKKVAKGPMGHAFLARNLLLPKEYFVPQGVDKAVAEWNEGIEYSLLDCPGKYTIKVATFKGRTTLEGANDPDAERTRRATENDPLVTGAEKAQRLAIALRSRDWEAYVFHDRHESYVAVGSFDEAAIKLMPDGRLMPAVRDAQTIIDVFGAATPHNLFNRPAQADLQKEQQVKARFTQQFSDGQVANGFYPKRFVGLPFDIQPTAVEVPKSSSISAAYARN